MSQGQGPGPRGHGFQGQVSSLYGTGTSASSAGGAGAFDGFDFNSMMDSPVRDFPPRLAFFPGASSTNPRAQLACSFALHPSPHQMQLRHLPHSSWTLLQPTSSVTPSPLQRPCPPAPRNPVTSSFFNSHSHSPSLLLSRIHHQRASTDRSTVAGRALSSPLPHQILTLCSRRALTHTTSLPLPLSCPAQPCPVSAVGET
jgi:hypothetical protein